MIVEILFQKRMPFRGVFVSRVCKCMGFSIDQMTNDGYFPTQKDHLDLLEGVPKIFALTAPPNYKLSKIGHLVNK